MSAVSAIIYLTNKARMLVLYYFQGEIGESLEQPNAVMVRILAICCGFLRFNFVHFDGVLGQWRENHF